MYSSSDLRSLIPNKISLEFLSETESKKTKEERKLDRGKKKRQKLQLLNNVHYVDRKICA